MKRIQILLCFSIFIYSSLLGQSCLPGYNLFSTQGQIDSFAINNPACTEILGDIVISESIVGAISNLNGLSQITAINGNLQILCNEVLETLSGLDNLTTIVGYVDITKNPSLYSLSALSNITEYISSFKVRNNGSLLNLDGLENLVYAHKGFHLSNNSNLTDISALSNLKSVGGTLILSALISMTDFSGLSSVETVEGSLLISGNFELENLTGLNNVKSVGDLEIVGNFVLNDITALSNLGLVKEDMLIQNNFTLASLSGLDNLNPDSIDFLLIQTCNNLTYCHVQSVCDYLEAGGDHYIEFNDNGCHSSEEILSWCDSVATDVRDISLDIELFPNPTSSEIQLVSDYYYKVTYEIRNASGKLLQKGFDNIIDLSAYANGVYFIKLSANEQSWVERVVKN